MDIWQLDNGIRCAYKEIEHSKIIHLGVAFDLGTRDEVEGKEGLVHFWEHMAFKGTQKRKAKAIMNNIEVLGGEINAYTTKEKIYFHISILSDHWKKALDILFDICFQSIFPKEEMKLEKGVILEEMAMYEDIPEEIIVDEFESKYFKGHPLGGYILGNRDSVKSIKRNDFLEFSTNRLTGNKIVFSGVGPISAKKLNKFIGKKLSGLSFNGEPNYRLKPKTIEVFDEVVKKNINQVHCMLGFKGLSLLHKDRVVLFMLVQYLGGPQMNSWLNMELREKRGLVYSVDANYTTYTDTGLVSVYFGCDPENLDKCYKLVLKGFKELVKEEVSEKKLKRLKTQIIAQLAMAEENNQGLMQVMARSILDLGYVQELDDLIKKVNAVTPERFLKVAQKIFDLKKMSVLKYVPN